MKTLSRRGSRSLYLPVGVALLLILGAAGREPVLAQGAGPSFNEPPRQGGGDGQDSRKPAKKKPDGKRESDEKQDPADAEALPIDEKAERQAIKDLGDIGSAFKVKRTKHFSVLYNTGEEEVGVFSTAIERTYRSCIKFTGKLDIKVKQPKAKLLIHYFNELKDYSAHSVKIGAGKRQETEPGFYVPGLNLSYFYNFTNAATFKQKREEAEKRIEQLREQLKNAKGAERKRISKEIKEAQWLITRTKSLGGDQNEATVQHEVAHQVLWNIGFHNRDALMANPRWLAEGAAQLFEPISTGKGANFGIVNSKRLKDFRTLAKAHKLVPLRDFLSDPVCFSNPDTAYPQSWALLHYMTRVKGEQLKTYVGLIAERPKDFQPTPKAELATVEKAFGKIDDKWVAAWLKWMESVR